MKGVGCACTRPTVPPEQKNGGEGPLVLPLGREWPARAEVSSELGAGAILTDFYSSFQVSNTQWSQPVSPVHLSAINKDQFVCRLLLWNSRCQQE